MDSRLFCEVYNHGFKNASFVIMQSLLFIILPLLARII